MHRRPQPIQAQRETRICIFCHTPHNAAPDSPLWNREIEPQIYTVYASPTLVAGVLPQPLRQGLVVFEQARAPALQGVEFSLGGIGFAAQPGQLLGDLGGVQVAHQLADEL